MLVLLRNGKRWDWLNPLVYQTQLLLEWPVTDRPLKLGEYVKARRFYEDAMAFISRLKMTEPASKISRVPTTQGSSVAWGRHGP